MASSTISPTFPYMYENRDAVNNLTEDASRQDHEHGVVACEVQSDHPSVTCEVHPQEHGVVSCEVQQEHRVVQPQEHRVVQPQEHRVVQPQERLSLIHI